MIGEILIYTSAAFVLFVCIKTVIEMFRQGEFVPAMMITAGLLLLIGMILVGYGI